MKKLLAAGCCVMALQSFSQVVAFGDEATEMQNGRKVLIKAIAVMVNAEAHRKLPPKRIHRPNLESPQD